MVLVFLPVSEKRGINTAVCAADAKAFIIHICATVQVVLEIFSFALLLYRGPQVDLVS